MQTDAEQVLVLGATGLLGTRLVPALAARNAVQTHSRHGGGSQHFSELSDAVQARDLLDRVQPSVIVNLAALTNVDVCQAQPQLAFLANVKLVENIAAWMQSASQPCHLVHISTDHVYDGAGPHTESDERIVNFYALSKYAGEVAARTVPSTVLRTNFFGRSDQPGRASLTDWLAQSLRADTPIDVFDDVMFSPLNLQTLVDLICTVVARRPVGLFNLGASQGMSKADFAFSFASALGFAGSNMTRLPVARSPTPRVPRPTDMRMDCSRIEQALAIRLPDLSSQIAGVAMEYSNAH